MPRRRQGGGRGGAGSWPPSSGSFRPAAPSSGAPCPRPLRSPCSIGGGVQLWSGLWRSLDCGEAAATQHPPLLLLLCSSADPGVITKEPCSIHQVLPCFHQALPCLSHQTIHQVPCRAVPDDLELELLLLPLPGLVAVRFCLTLQLSGAAIRCSLTLPLLPCRFCLQVLSAATVLPVLLEWNSWCCCKLPEACGGCCCRLPGDLW